MFVFFVFVFGRFTHNLSFSFKMRTLNMTEDKDGSLLTVIPF